MREVELVLRLIAALLAFIAAMAVAMVGGGLFLVAVTAFVGGYLAWHIGRPLPKSGRELLGGGWVVCSDCGQPHPKNAVHECEPYR